MANNRLFMVNKRLGGRVLLAKYYPSTGWYFCDGADVKLHEEFSRDKYRTLWGNTDWELEYEQEDT